MPVTRARSGGVRILAQSAAGVSGAADANENTLATVTVPGGALGLNGRLRVTALFTVTNSVNNKVLRVRFSGISGTIYHTVTLTTNASYKVEADIANRGATNSQVGGMASIGGGWGTSGSAVITSAVDTTADTTLLITGQKVTAGETLTLESYLVELIV